jgi:hypothetical protein
MVESLLKLQAPVFLLLAAGVVLSFHGFPDEGKYVIGAAVGAFTANAAASTKSPNA